MKIFIIDTNIIFSTAIKPDSNIAQFIREGVGSKFELYSPNLLLEELKRHRAKAISVSKMDEKELDRNLKQILDHISFVSESEIPVSYFFKALPLVRDVDINDISFVALTDYMDELLWTGDRRLESGLKAKGYKKVLNFQEVRELINEQG